MNLLYLLPWSLDENRKSLLCLNEKSMLRRMKERAIRTIWLQWWYRYLTLKKLDVRDNKKLCICSKLKHVRESILEVRTVLFISSLILRNVLWFITGAGSMPLHYAASGGNAVCCQVSQWALSHFHVEDIVSQLYIIKKTETLSTDSDCSGSLHHCWKFQWVCLCRLLFNLDSRI
jgi:hypothetical protein